MGAVHMGLAKYQVVMNLARVHPVSTGVGCGSPAAGTISPAMYLQQILAVTRNTFFESVRQPITLVVIIAGTLLLILSNPLSAFTMDDDQRMLIDIGLATVFLAGAVLAAFIATSVLGREISNRTALTVVSKPIGRPTFLLGKFIGATIALLLAIVILALVFMLVEMHTVLQTVRDPMHVPVIIFSGSAAIIAVLVAVWCNYFYGTVFTSMVIFTGAPLLLVAYLLTLNFSADFSAQDMAISFKPNLWLAMIAILTSVMMLSAIAVAVSTRLGQVMTLLVTTGLFVLGLLSDWIFGRPLHAIEADWGARAAEAGKVEQVEVATVVERMSGETQTLTDTIDVAIVPLADFATGSELAIWWLLKAGYSILPNFQVLWLSDAVTQDIAIPTSYLLQSTIYGVIYTAAALAAGVLLFQRRDLG